MGDWKTFCLLFATFTNFLVVNNNNNGTVAGCSTYTARTSFKSMSRFDKNKDNLFSRYDRLFHNVRAFLQKYVLREKEKRHLATEQSNIRDQTFSSSAVTNVQLRNYLDNRFFFLFERCSPNDVGYELRMVLMLPVV